MKKVPRSDPIQSDPNEISCMGLGYMRYAYMHQNIPTSTSLMVINFQFSTKTLKYASAVNANTKPMWKERCDMGQRERERESTQKTTLIEK